MAEIHPQSRFAAQIRQADGSEGSGYLVGPGTIVTALHCAIDGETVPDEPVKCGVRLVGDNRRKDQGPWDFVTAKLAWPKAGAKVADCDIAVLVVDEDQRTETMKSDPQIGAHIPQRRQKVEGFGFPLWTMDKGQAYYRRIPGALESEEPQFGALSDFDIDKSTPLDNAEWHGASGTLLFIEGTKLAVGVVSTKGRSRNNSLLAATALRKVQLAGEFWSVTGIESPSMDDKVLRQAKAILPSQFLHLFDRGQQFSRWILSYDEFVSSDQPVPIVPLIIADKQDEWTFLAKRLEGDLEARFPQHRGVYRDAPPLTWPEYATDAEDAAKQVLIQIKRHLRINERFDLLTDAKPFQKALNSGSVPRAFRLELTKADASSYAEAAMDIILNRLAAFGPCDTPVVLLINIDRSQLMPEAAGDPFECEVLGRLAHKARQFAGRLTWIPMVPALHLCEPKDLDEWETALRKLDDEQPDMSSFSVFHILGRINPRETDRDNPFRFRSARAALAEMGL